MGPYRSKKFKTILFQIAGEKLLDFLLHGPYKTTLGIFEILKN